MIKKSIKDYPKLLTIVVLVSIILYACNKNYEVLNDKLQPDIIVDPASNEFRGVVRGQLDPEYFISRGVKEINRDRDKDGIINSYDNCPSVFNPDQVDTDNDGVGDACDLVNDDPDSDGIINVIDNCDNAYNPDQADTDGDGIGDACDANIILDIDGDGVPDSRDNCPTVPNPTQADFNSNGIGDACDAAIPPMPVYKFVLLLDFDGYDLQCGGSFFTTGFYPPSKLSAVEIKNIVDTVRSKFKNYNVTITTDQNIYNSALKNYRLRIVISGRTDCDFCGNGGVAIQSMFDDILNNGIALDTDCNPAFVFEHSLLYNQASIAQTISHEYGHTLGLFHQSSASCTGCNEYSTGGTKPYVPIMGTTIGATSKKYADWNVGLSGCDYSLPCFADGYIQNDTLILRKIFSK